MKLGYCYECDYVINTDVGESCKCGNIYGEYDKDSRVGNYLTACSFLVRNPDTCKCVGIHSMFIWNLGQDIEKNWELVCRLVHSKVYTTYPLSFELKIVWDKPWSQATLLGKATNIEGCEEYKDYIGYTFD